jgi:hypothetical protein
VFLIFALIACAPTDQASRILIVTRRAGALVLQWLWGLDSSLQEPGHYAKRHDGDTGHHVGCPTPLEIARSGRSQLQMKLQPCDAYKRKGEYEKQTFDPSEEGKKMRATQHQQD